MLRILIGDDHEVVRRGLKELLREEFGEAELAEAEDGAQMLERISAAKWDLILLDILMPGMNVIDMLTRIREHDPAVPVLILTAVSEIQYAVRTLKAGANGYLTKQHAGTELIHAVRQLLTGHTYLTPEAMTAMAEELRGGETGAPHEALSLRELEVFRLIALGKAIKEIAFELSLSPKTVATYLARIKDKTGLDNPADIARYALQNNLID